MSHQINFDAIREKRWFMGKSRSISTIRQHDSIEIGGTCLSVIEVGFQDGGAEYYSFIDDESCVGQVLEQAFRAGPLCIMPGTKGRFVFQANKVFAQGSFTSARPVDGEQSNSAFIAPPHSFFKLYRRMQNGVHPEPEVLKHLENANADFVPKLQGTCRYMAASGEEYAFGVLEEFIPNAKDAWAFFCGNMDCKCASLIGEKVAAMHKALKTLHSQEATFHPQEASPKSEKSKVSPQAIGQGIQGETPFAKLQLLLEKSTDPLAVELKCKFPLLMQQFAELTDASSELETQELAPQRIHGDLHLGQILLSECCDAFSKSAATGPLVKIMDFEGEPSRPLEFRRRLRSPAADVAGMIRSFQYASASSSQDSSACEQSFLEAYSKVAGLSLKTLEGAIRPYILSKAVYEACYELEYRPSWFHIPAKALLQSLTGL